MLSHCKNFVIATVTIIVLDFIWLNYIAKNIYTQQLGKFFSYNDNGLVINYAAGSIVYILLAAGIMLFVLPRATTQLNAYAYGACFGCVVYGVYDFTNLAIIHSWPLYISLIDVMWGTFVCAAASLITFLFK